MTYDPDIHKRRSIRLRDWDYSQTGAYFVTICTKDKKCFFGDITDGEMRLNEYGRIVEREWAQTHDLRQNVHIDEFVVMPNHFHGILVMEDSGRGTARRALKEYDDNGGHKGTAHRAPT